METIRNSRAGTSPLDAWPESSDALAPNPPGVKRLHAAARHGRFRSWGLLILAILLGLMISMVGLDRPTPVSIGDTASAAGPASDHAQNGIGADPNPAGPADEAVVDGASAGDSSGAVVHVVGEVAQPGVFTLPVGARVADAVAAAGGPLPGAELSGVNLARRVKDGEQIVVGPVAPPASPITTGGSGVSEPVALGSEATLVDLNQATATDLQELPRVGPVTAEKIIAHREQHGPFTAVEQLLEVPGIGEATLAGLRDLVTV